MNLFPGNLYYYNCRQDNCNTDYYINIEDFTEENYWEDDTENRNQEFEPGSPDYSNQGYRSMEKDRGEGSRNNPNVEDIEPFPPGYRQEIAESYSSGDSGKE